MIALSTLLAAVVAAAIPGSPRATLTRTTPEFRMGQDLASTVASVQEDTTLIVTKITTYEQHVSKALGALQQPEPDVDAAIASLQAVHQSLSGASAGLDTADAALPASSRSSSRSSSSSSAPADGTSSGSAGSASGATSQTPSASAPAPAGNAAPAAA